MDILAKFVTEHLEDDTARLILKRSKYPEIDMDMAINCIESRRKLKGKVQEWYDEPGLLFPLKLSAEQCSSSATGAYKAEVAENIMSGSARDDRWSIMDLTGGLGVDSWFFSQKASKTIYCEMQESLCKAARHNFHILKSENITVNNIQITRESCKELLTEHKPDIVYIDPARRGEGGKKVFLIEECTPDVLTLKEEIFTACRHILIKLSPMADITMVCDRLGETCREVHVVSAGGECKELLIWMDREWHDEYNIVAVELHQNSPAAIFRFKPSEERQVANGPYVPLSQYGPDRYLYEPGKSLMKSGAFNLIGEIFGVHKLGKSTHYYLTDSLETAERLKPYGKVYRILGYSTLDKKSIRETGAKYPKAEVTARNIPMDTDTLRKKLGISSGDDAHIFGLKSDSEGNLLITSRRLP